jgi:hypothetical protein
MMIHRITGLLAVCLALAGCGGGKGTPPADALDRFPEYYAEELFLTERARLMEADSGMLRRQLDSLGAAYAITGGARDSILGYYRDSLPRWESFLADVARRLDERGVGDDTGRSAPAEPAAAGR